MCGTCIDEQLKTEDKLNPYPWDKLDHLCQIINIPWIPARFEEIHELNESKPFLVYSQLFENEEYRGLNWAQYYSIFKELEEKNIIEDELPRLKEARHEELIQKWGGNYDDEALNYLESLYNGLLSTQNINGALQGDQALKLCKISYEIDCRIREGVDFDKYLSAYDKLVKVAGFTPKNAKNLNDFDTVGELLKWLEKGGWRARYYDGATRDVVDETMKNIENHNQRLYVNETGIGDEITHRLENLKSAQQLESYYNTNETHDLESYDNDGFNELFKDDEEEDFQGGLNSNEKKSN